MSNLLHRPGRSGKYMTRAGVVAYLRGVADQVESGDCRAAHILFNSFFREYPDQVPGEDYCIIAEWRSGNNEGMGTVTKIVSPAEGDPAPPEAP